MEIVMNTQSVTTVVFHGHQLTTLEHHSETYVAMKPVCEAIGLQWEAQLKRIRRNPVLRTSMSMMDIQMEGDD
ncbi:hypothetical protein MED297_17712 [Reinekea sp. MED297]|uniref:Antirepressor protein ant N-terminal domain-containing protein n=1 Tax=Reinekea blandensis MED297 TaxID=314283 RepID=A4BHA5_9GAMM|nr:hypothetical protein MED297_17712 [Reinekea sp. MED297] [Reinekea blandensis MED297]